MPKIDWKDRTTWPAAWRDPAQYRREETPAGKPVRDNEACAECGATGVKLTEHRRRILCYKCLQRQKGGG